MRMQLKKKFALKKRLAVGAVTVAMIASSVPALAAEGHGHGGRSAGHGTSSQVNRGSRHSGYSGNKGLNCLTDARHAYAQELKNAQAERDAARKAALDAYHAAMQTAREDYQTDLFHSATVTPVVFGDGKLTFVASSTNQAAKRAARQKYHDAVKKAQSDFSVAKKQLMQQYRDELKAARDKYKADSQACLTASAPTPPPVGSFTITPETGSASSSQQ